MTEYTVLTDQHKIDIVQNQLLSAEADHYAHTLQAEQSRVMAAAASLPDVVSFYETKAREQDALIDAVNLRVEMLSGLMASMTTPTS